MARSTLRRYFRHGLLPQLIAFEAVVRLGGVTRAAHELSLAQPTVSGLLRKLADTMGEPLIQVRRGRVDLTDAGREVALFCEEVLAAVQRFDERRQNFGAGFPSQNPGPGIPITMAPWSHVPEPPSPSK